MTVTPARFCFSLSHTHTHTHTQREIYHANTHLPAVIYTNMHTSIIFAKCTCTKFFQRFLDINGQKVREKRYEIANEEIKKKTEYCS